MLTDNVLLSHIKGNLGYPFTEIELLDKDILHYSKDIVLRKFFSPYYPAIKFHKMSLDDPDVKTDVDNRFKILDPDNAGIIEIIAVLRDYSALMYFGSVDFYGTLTYSAIPDWAMRAVQSQLTMSNSAFNSTHQLIYPNYIELRPPRFYQSGDILVIYEAEHVNFNHIPTYAEQYLMDLCLAYIKRIIGQIRGKYSELSTVFGNININYSEMKQEGQELWDKVMEHITTKPPYNMIEIF